MPRTPDTIGKYKVISEVARGGMGAVYTAEHPTLDRTVIIKKLTMRGSASVRERFRREASIMMDFRNEYIVDVFDHFREGPAYYIVQEFVDGMSLSELLQRERYLPERIALLIFRDCCRALKYAHDRGVIHRDIKPGNILISRNGDVKLVDFGIAHIDDENEDALTKEGTMLGTPSYMAPEQFQDTRSVDKRADIYSLGVMLYEMMTGKRPFSGSINAETLRAIQHGKYRKARKLNPAITRFTSRMLRRAMNAKRSRRFQDLGAVLAKLDHRFVPRAIAAHKGEIASYIGGEWSPPRGRSRARRAVATVVAALLIIAAGAVYYGFQTGRVYELLDPGRYGTLRVILRVPRDSQPAADLNVSANLFRDDGKAIPRVKGAAFPFHVDPKQNTKETMVFTSPPVFVPAGQYRLKVTVGSRLIWKGFYLESRKRQAKAGGAPAGRDLVVSVARQARLPLSVAIDVTSASDGQDITNGTSVQLLSNGTWIPFAGDVVASLRSGTAYQFRLTRDGFYPADYALAVDPLQTELRIDASLVPIPGAVSISSDSETLHLSVDGAQTYRRWGRTPEPVPVPMVGPKPIELSLAPGAHTITARSGSLQGSYSADVLPLQRLGLKVTVDRKAGRLDFSNTGYVAAPGLAR